MICPRCDVELVPGIAINPGSRGIPDHAIVSSQYVANASTLQIINILKCPKCGYSDDGIDGRQCVGIENHNS